MKFIDLTGQRFGRLTVVKRVANNKNNKVVWSCECDCGGYKNVVSAMLINGDTMSCGCLHKETVSKIGKNNKKYNKYDLNREYGIGYDKNGKEFYFDLDDYNKIRDYCWNIDSDGYVKSQKDNKTIKLHRLLVDYNLVDHKNRNRSDCRKNNLRSATHAQNSFNCSISSKNKTGFIGVAKTKYNSYRSVISYKNKKISLGSYASLEEAIIARLKAEKEYYGEFAPQRHLFEKYNI